MKILHVIPSVSPKRGGPSSAIRIMAQAMASKGADVHIATTDDDNEGHLLVPLDRPVVDSGVTLHYFQRQTSFYTFSWPLTQWLWKNIETFDLLHIHSLFSYSTLPATRIANYRRIPYIIRPLGQLNRWGLVNRRSMLKNLSLRLIEYSSLKQAHLIHYASGQERLEAYKLGIDHPSIIVPLSVNVKSLGHLPKPDIFFNKYPLLQDKIRILFLARLDRIKGINLLLNAFAQIQVQYPNLALIVAGSGDSEYEAILRVQASTLGIKNSITWLGFVDSQEKEVVLSAADLFILPSYFESFGVAVVEAMAAGIPVIVSDQVGLHYEVTKFETGLVTTCDIDTIVKQISTLIDDSHLRRRMSINGQQLVQRRFSPEAMSKELMKMYQQVTMGSTQTGDDDSTTISATNCEKK